jgi:hypothetical protein
VTAGREILALQPIADDPEVGRWLAALEDGRRETLNELEGLTSEMVDWYPAAPQPSIGSLLYHLGLVEASWVFDEILGDPAAEVLAPRLPGPDREGPGVGGQRHLSRVDGQPLDASGTLPGGERFSGPAELKQVLLKKAPEFEENLTRKLLGFSLGRELRARGRRPGQFDQCVVDDAMKALKSRSPSAVGHATSISLSSAS